MARLHNTAMLLFCIVNVWKMELQDIQALLRSRKCIKSIMLWKPVCVISDRIIYTVKMVLVFTPKQNKTERHCCFHMVLLCRLCNSAQLRARTPSFWRKYIEQLFNSFVAMWPNISTRSGSFETLKNRQPRAAELAAACSYLADVLSFHRMRHHLSV